jgi:Flp pilus assembly protein TadD
VPTIGLVQAHVQALADRFAYVPVIGVFIMVVWAAADCAVNRPQRRVLQAAAALALAGCVVMTSLQLRYWRNSLTLTERAVHVAKDNHIAHLMLGNVLYERGQLEAALHQYLEALRLRGDDSEVWQRAGVALSQQGKSADAISYFRTAIQLSPRRPEPRRSLAQTLALQGRTAEARAAYEALAPLMPQTPKGHTQLAEMLAEGQQPAEAIQHYREALRLNPNYQPALNNLAWLHATWAQGEWRDGNEAVQLAERACQLSRHRVPHFLGALAAAYAETGRFNEAIQTIREAQALAQASGATNLLPVHAMMLQHFQAGRPFHEGGR